ncbi:Plant/T7H20-70 protein [Melia azedarach]|uniref:Plant/T7H20-70 protein n=1 Tax=Melia azedarach TaxID=155640 RepID=A0ACC1YR68_MELAZ|nr:Plant/T7H20-70 protein [Melia azedarach]
MDAKREMASSSSFTADLFGTKESPSSSTGIFASILSPASSVVGRNSSKAEILGTWHRQPSGNQVKNNKQGIPALHTEIVSCDIPNKDRSYLFQEEIAEPCHLSSSLYYGGQDIYSQSPDTHASGLYPILKKDGGEDDNGNNSHGASRGNWWQGSLYY